MKKVLVLAAALALFATPAVAAISNSKHDLSTNDTSSFSTDSTEICVFCHTPHGAATGAATDYLPLWNRTAAVVPTLFYTSDTLDNTAGLVTTDAYLCLSCHDGATAMEALNNPPNSGLTNNTTLITGTARLDTDLSNDHPIGFVYNAAIDIKPHGTGNSQLVASPAAPIIFFGSGGDEMWCSSCHDVHDPTNVPFLVMDNAGSALCLACHIK